VLHALEEGNAERLGGFARSLGVPVADPDLPELEQELRLDELEAGAHKALGDRTVPFLFGYRVRIGLV
jgi:hypothetical protein